MRFFYRQQSVAPSGCTAGCSADQFPAISRAQSIRQSYSATGSHQGYICNQSVAVTAAELLASRILSA